jgi:hypothetical protein
VLRVIVFLSVIEVSCSTKALKSARELNGLVSGGLAVITAFTVLDPWLCVPAFRRVCLYRKMVAKVQTKRAWLVTRPAKADQHFIIIFGGLAVVVT